MPVRELITNNTRWKFTALLLALLVWTVIKFAIYKTDRTQTVRQQIVLVLKAPEDPSIIRVEPPEVDVTVQSTKELRPEDLEVFVNLSGMPADVPSAFKQVLVRGVEVGKVITVKPPVVRVVRVVPPEASLMSK